MRGKHAASATAQKLRAAETKLAEAESRSAAERHEADVVQQAQDVEIRQLQSRLVNEVAALADARVQEVQSRAAEEIAAVRSEYRDRMLAGFGLIHSMSTVTLPAQLWPALAELWDVPLGDLLKENASFTNRRVRRATAQKVRANLAQDKAFAQDRAIASGGGQS